MNISCLRQTDAGVELLLYIQPRASRNKIVGFQGEELKVALTAPPVNGAANKAIRGYFAKLCKLHKSHVSLVSGESSRHKRLLLEGVEPQRILLLLKDFMGT